MPRAPTREKSHKSKPYSRPEKSNQQDPLHVARPRQGGIGGNVRRFKDLGRYVKMPKYVRLQRQRSILVRRLKVPPALNHFNFTLPKNAATNLFKLLLKYRPETRTEKRDRLKAAASGSAPNTGKPHIIKYGLNHITTLIEQKQAKLVIIANDVDPVEVSLRQPSTAYSN